MKKEKRIENGKALQKLVAVSKITGQGEAVAADGGALVAKGVLPEILSPNFAEGSLYADCRIVNVGEGKNGLRIPVALESTRSVTNIRGGYRAYVVAEGATKTASDGSFGVLDLGLNKAAVVIPATDEIIQDAEALSSYMNDSAEEALKGLVDYSILHGNGIMNAITGSPCTGGVALTDPLTLAELHNFFDAYYGGKDGKWYVSKVRFGQILDLFENGSGSILLTSSEGKYYLFGYEMVVCDMFLDNDMMLADLSQYVIIQKEMTSEVNESLKFVEDEKYFRYVLRVNGAPIWKAPITLADASVVYPFVISTDMEKSSSSSSSSSEVENLSSSSSSSTPYSSSSSSDIELRSSSSSTDSSQSDSSQSDSSQSDSSQSESSSSSSTDWVNNSSSSQS